jgi:hypothetical protein
MASFKANVMSKAITLILIARNLKFQIIKLRVDSTFINYFIKYYSFY